MPFEDPPSAACWLHRGLRTGFEVVHFEHDISCWLIVGTTTGLQDGNAWVVSYDIKLDHLWRTQLAHVTARTPFGSREQVIETDGDGHWRVDDAEAPDIEGCLDIDLESSAMTNAFPVRRLDLAVGERADAPACYYQVDTGKVDRLHQSYRRIEDSNGRRRYAYEAPAFDFECELIYDASGLVLDYPGIAARVT